MRKLLLIFALCQSSWGAYAYRATIAVNASQIAGTLTDYVLTVNQTLSHLALATNGGTVQSTCTQTDPGSGTLAVPCDAVFLSSGGALLSFYFESYNAITGAFIAKVRVPSIAVGTVVFLDSGDAAVTTYQGNVTGTYASYFVGAWPFPNGATLSVADFSGHNTTTNSGAAAAAGKVGGAASFGGSQGVNAGTAAGAVDNLTISAWVNWTSLPAGFFSIVGKRNSAATTCNYAINYNSSSNLQVLYCVGGAAKVLTVPMSGNFTTGNWYLIAATYAKSGTSTIVTLYKNGAVLAGPTTLAGNVVTDGADNLWIGAGWFTTVLGEMMNGSLDNVWIANTAVSGAQLAADYANQNAPGAFYTFTAPAGTPPAITGLALSASASTINAQWSTAVFADTHLQCGTAPGGPYTIHGLLDSAASATTHYDVIAGLSAATNYYCTVSGTNWAGTTTSGETPLTSTAQPATTPIADITLVGHGLTAQHPSAAQWLGTRYNSMWPTHYMGGDTVYNTACANGTTYLALNDTHNFDQAVTGTAFTAAYQTASTSDISINTLTGMPLIGSTVNFMTGWGFGTQALSDGKTSKEFAITCINDRWSTDTLYLGATRQGNACPAPHTAGGVIKSLDYGVTWANWLAPSTTDANGAVPSPLSSNWPGATNNPSGRYSTLGFVMYEPGGADTLRVHNQDAYIYMLGFGATGVTSNWADGDATYLMRIPRWSMPPLDGTAIQYFLGGDGNLNSQWSTSAASAVPVLSDVGKHSVASVQYISSLNRYVMIDWYYPSNCADTHLTVWVVYESPYPWGPWTPIWRAQWHPNGWYNPVILQSSASAASLQTTGNTIKVITSGDWNQQSAALNSAAYLYQLAYFDIQLGTSPRLRFGASANPYSIPSQGLVAAWDMHPKGSVSTVADLSVFGNAATDINAAGTFWGALGYRATSGTANGLVTTMKANPRTGSGFTDMTIAVVFQSDTADALGNFGKLAAQLNAAGTDVDWYIQRNGTVANSFGCGFFDGAPAYSTAFTDGSWHLLVCRRNAATGLVETMRNGSTVVASKTEPTTTVNTTGAVKIGFSGVGSDYANSTIAGVLIWDRVLSNAELDNTYRSLKLSIAPNGVVLP